MARPREINIKQENLEGTIYLQDFPTDVANKLQAHIESFFKGNTPVEPLKIASGPLTEKAIGTRIHPGTRKAQFVTVVYNGESGEAKVEKIVDCDGLRDSSVKFKVAAGDLNFI